MLNAKKFYFTFGINSPMSKYLQVIIAPSFEAAEKRMKVAWGKNYAFGYTESEFAESRERGSFRDLKPLDTLYVGKPITVAETAELLERFETIKGGARIFRLKRLTRLANDIQLSYDIEKDAVANQIFLDVEKEIAFAEVDRVV